MSNPSDPQRNSEPLSADRQQVGVERVAPPPVAQAGTRFARRSIRPKDILVLALSSLGANKLRSSLTVLGITIGVFSVVGVMTALSAIRNSIDESLSFLGANVFQIARQPPIQTGGAGVRWWQRPQLTPRDAERFERLMAEQAPGLAVTRFAVNNGERIRIDDRRTGANISVYGTNENFILTNKYEIDAGRNLTAADLEFNRPVAVIGTTVINSLFPSMDPIGQEIIIRGDRFEVVGTLRERGELFGSSLDNTVLIPINRFVARHWNWRRSMDIAVQASSPEALAFEQDLAVGIMRLVRGLDPGEENDFEVFSNDSLQAAFANIARIVGAAGLGVSAIALLCAGIGIMNIMLVSVTERTREIGVRMSLGARRRDILHQFLLEAVFLCEIGALFGILLGVAVGNVVAVQMDVPMILPWFWISAAVVICSAIGITFGLFPALRAANLNPVEALRYE